MAKAAADSNQPIAYQGTTESKTKNCAAVVRAPCPFFKRRSAMNPHNYIDRRVVSLMSEMVLEGAERHDTRSEINEICINYLQGHCFCGKGCPRVHPVDKARIRKILLENSEASRQRSAPSISVETLINSKGPEHESTPTVKLPRLGDTGRHNEDLASSNITTLNLSQDDRSSSVEFPSWDPASWNPLFEEQDWSESGGPSWDPETGSWGETKTQDWTVGSDSSETASHASSRRHLRVPCSSEQDRTHHYPAAQCFERCDTWLKGIEKSAERRHRRPPCYPDRCRQWLRNECQLGYECRYVHDDLEYEPEEDQEHKRVWSVTLHDHIKVKFSAGFEIESIITGFETSYVYVLGIPNDTTSEEVLELLKPFGNVCDIRMTDKSVQPTKTARVHFSRPEEAQIATSRLKHVTAFGSELSAQLPVPSAVHKNAMFKHGTVIVEWEPPGQTWYAGYKDLAEAQKAITQTCAMSRDNPIQAQIHRGLPAAGAVTVRIRGLPGHFCEQDLQSLANSSSVICERAKYTNLPRATRIIQSRLEEFGELLSFHVNPPSQKGFKIRALARFVSPNAADEACRALHGLCPTYTGRTRLFAHHDRIIEYRVSYENFLKLSPDIEALRRYMQDRFKHDASILISGNGPVVVELRARALKILGQIKSEFEKITLGDVVKSGGKIIWDDFFASPSGIHFVQNLQANHGGISIRIESFAHKIRLFGPSHIREAVARLITDKVLELGAQRISFITLAGRLIGIFTSKVLDLQQDLGPENVVLDISNQRLKIRGDDAVYRRALGLVRKVCAGYSSRLQSSQYSCPVCLEEPTEFIRLPCGHRWCRACLASYLVAATSNIAFPLGCLGDGARCEQKIPLVFARHLLSLEEFQSVVEASFSAYVQSRPDEFHFCPSPDCPQVYRAAPKSLECAAVQCPSCLLHICPACHQEAHEGFSCADDDDWDEDFKQWAKLHDVQRCPGCRITIERIEGCNHMTCTRCQTHICWVCMKTFPKGEGIYGHMRTEHGDFGLGPI